MINKKKKKENHHQSMYDVYISIGKRTTRTDTNKMKNKAKNVEISKDITFIQLFFYCHLLNFNFMYMKSKNSKIKKRNINCHSLVISSFHWNFACIYKHDPDFMLFFVVVGLVSKLKYRCNFNCEIFWIFCE